MGPDGRQPQRQERHHDTRLWRPDGRGNHVACTYGELSLFFCNVAFLSIPSARPCLGGTASGRDGWARIYAWDDEGGITSPTGIILVWHSVCMHGIQHRGGITSW